MKQNNSSDNTPASSFADTPTARKMQQDVDQFGIPINIYKVLRFFGYRNDTMEQVSAQYRELAKQTKELITLIDEFNEVFLEHGWISHESMNAIVAREGLDTYKSKGLHAAEQVLVKHYDADTIKLIGLLFTPIKEFEPRKKLFHLALEDYVAERYHACIPVQLLIIDGLVNDLSKVKGFFADGVKMEAWDSIAGHNDALNKLAELFRSSRTRTTTEPLVIPYRHGIMHGRDLDYSSKLVAAKLWASLQAICDFARAKQSEQRRKFDAPKILADLSLEERAVESQESWDYIRSHFSWRARSPEQLSAIPSTGEPEAYEAGSPERALVEFLWYWQASNYGKMAELIIPTDKQATLGSRAGRIREDFQNHKLTDFRIIQVEDSLSTMTIITCQLTAKHSDTTTSTDHKFFLNYCSVSWETLPAGAKHGRWVVDYLVYPCVIFSDNNPLGNSKGLSEEP